MEEADRVKDFLRKHGAEFEEREVVEGPEKVLIKYDSSGVDSSFWQKLYGYSKGEYEYPGLLDDIPGAERLSKSLLAVPTEEADRVKDFLREHGAEFEERGSISLALKGGETPFWEAPKRVFQEGLRKLGSAKRKVSASVTGGSNPKSARRLAALLITSLILGGLIILPGLQQASALSISISDPSPTDLGETIEFDITVNVKDGELLPIQEINLDVNGPTTHDFTITGLPLTDTSKTYTTSGGTVEISATPGSGWGYGYGYGYVGGYGYGYRYAEWKGYGYSWGKGYGYGGYGYGHGYWPSTGYGYGYGYGFSGTQITYHVTWHSPSDWPAGDYDFTAKVKADGDEFAETKTVALSQPGPTADFSYSPTRPNPDETVSFDASTSSDSNGSIASYNWSFGDGTTGSGVAPSHSYSSGGNYDVTLTVADDGGVTDSITKTVSVNQPPTADADGPYEVDEGETVELDGTGSSDPENDSLTYSWTITDDPTGGASLTDSTTPTPTFNAPSVDANYDVTVELSVSDNYGLSDTDTATVTIVEKAKFDVSDLRVSPGTVEPDEQINISAKVKNVGGKTGNYTVTLQVSGENRGTETVSLASGSSTRVSFTVTENEPGTYSVSLDGLSDDFMVYVSEEVESQSTEEVDNINAGETADVTVENVFITSLRITAKNSVTDVSITIQQFTTAPSGVPDAPGTPYRYIYIAVENMSDSDFENVTISFKVEKSWVTDSGINENTITLQRYDPDEESWEDISTELVDEDDTYYYFEATTTHLSTFAIAGERVEPSVTTESASNITSDSATLNMSYDFKGYDSGQVRFQWKETGSSWNSTSWVSKSGSGSYSKDISGLSSDTEHEFKAQLKYDDQVENGSIKTFTTESPAAPVNEVPTADADGPYSVDEGGSVALDGTGSFDPDGDTLTYSWTITDDPTGGASLTDSTTPTPTFNAPSVDEDTEVTVQLTVSDGHGHTDSAIAIVTVRDVAVPNEAPTADADGPYSVDEGESVALDGTGSSDSDGTIESYSWEITSGPGSLQNANTAEPTYVAPEDVDEDTEVTVSLTVTDDDGATNSATAIVTVRDVAVPNEAPTADADGPYSVDEGESVALDGTGSSDPDGTIESYSWEITSGPGSLQNANTAEPTYVAPEDVDEDTTVTVSLTVTDDDGATNSATATVTVKDVAVPNEAPIADADGPYSVDEGESVALDGTGSSDPDGSIESYSWEITSGPGSLEGADTAEPTYVAPEDVDEDTEVTVSLAVTDDDGATDSTTATITVKDVPAEGISGPIVLAIVIVIIALLAVIWYWRK